MLGLSAMALLQEKAVSWDLRSLRITAPHGFWEWILIGLIAGWLAGKLGRGRGFGCIGDILLGLIGSVIGGWIFTKLGIVHENAFLLSLAAATVGAVVLVAIGHLFFGGRER
ncbi:MAG TPA: GlsB/YeaQ/YmgE family stress response membrane protein [Candidatus Acidoferrum sp.]|nr:GlsB/YeaQ/YmgE family stress response membrane protein [Candidatus Acidoferrum sp.]